MAAFCALAGVAWAAGVRGVRVMGGVREGEVGGAAGDVLLLIFGALCRVGLRNGVAAAVVDLVVATVAGLRPLFFVDGLGLEKVVEGETEAGVEVEAGAGEGTCAGHGARPGTG